MFSSADWLTGSVIPFWSLEAFKLSMSCCARGSLVCSDGWRSDPVAWKCILGSLKKRRPVVGFQNGSSNRGFGSEKTTGMGGGVFPGSRGAWAAGGEDHDLGVVREEQRNERSERVVWTSKCLKVWKSLDAWEEFCREKIRHHGFAPVMAGRKCLFPTKKQ